MKMLLHNFKHFVAALMAVSMCASPAIADCGQIIIYSRVNYIPPPVVYYPPPIWQGFPTNQSGPVNVIVNIDNNNKNNNVVTNNNPNQPPRNNPPIKVYPNPEFPVPPGNRPTNPPPRRPPTTNPRPGDPPTRPPLTNTPTRPPNGNPPGQGRTPGGGRNEWVTSVTSRGDSFTEPNQYAVVAWNGTEEILWIRTKQKSLVPGEGAALSIMPMPGKPISVTRGDDELYTKCFEAVETKLAANAGVASRAPLLEVKIGAHNIFVLEGKSVENLEEQIQDFISKRFDGKAAGMIGDNTREVIADYLSRDFQYFAFDLIDSTEEEEVKVPIQYRFESDYCYYPMVVSKIGGTGNTEVEIVAFTKDSLTQHAPTALTFEEVTTEESVNFTSEELLELSPDIQKLFGNDGAVARQWYIEGDMKSFKGDIAWR